MTPLLVVGAHLDDAVLSCGRHLARTPGAVVCTVFAGRPGPSDRVPGTTEWDRACGFGPSSDVVGARTREDDEATAALAATPLRLGFVDAQYARAPSVDDVRDALADVLLTWRPEHVLVPVGLYHRDHRWTAVAALHALADTTSDARGLRATWALYTDQPYGRWARTAARREAWRRCGVGTGPGRRLADGDLTAEQVRRHRRALAAYASQLTAVARLAGRRGPDLPADAAAGATDAAGSRAAADADETWPAAARATRTTGAARAQGRLPPTA